MLSATVGGEYSNSPRFAVEETQAQGNFIKLNHQQFFVPLLCSTGKNVQINLWHKYKIYLEFRDVEMWVKKRVCYK